MKTTCVMDSSAILSLVGQEDGSSFVLSKLSGSIMSALSWSEVVVVLQNIGMTTQDIDDTLKQLSVQIIPFDLDQATLAATLHRITGTANLSLANRACLALARTHKLPVLTAQKAWENMPAGVEIIYIGYYQDPSTI